MLDAPVRRAPPPGRGAEAIIGARLHVGNLSEATSEDELRELFSEAGEVAEISIPLDRETGRPRGFAYLQMQDEIDAVTALHMLDGRSLHDQKIQISRAADDGGDGDGGASPAGKPAFKRFKSKGSRRGVRGRKRSL